MPTTPPSPNDPAPADTAARPGARRLLITAGPTHEPIDAVRFIGNRSSGRLGTALAEAAAKRAHPSAPHQRAYDVTLLLGPATLTPSDSRVRVRRFRTCEDLRALLAEEAGACDVLVMAAAVADYRPKIDPAFQGGKFRRTGQKMTLELESTPDLIAEVSARRRPGQTLVGFALEPREELASSARAKLQRKGLDMVVGNPLQTMDSADIDATVFLPDGSEQRPPGALSKERFAEWFLDLLAAHAGERAGSPHASEGAVVSTPAPRAGVNTSSENLR
jgi:phosphopantothenoylcysteine decarboxylase/phosphopantothenate--cysteine ligase